MGAERGVQQRVEREHVRAAVWEKPPRIGTACCAGCGHEIEGDDIREEATTRRDGGRAVPDGFRWWHPECWRRYHPSGVR